MNSALIGLFVIQSQS